MSAFYRNVFLEFLTQYYKCNFYQVSVIALANQNVIPSLGKVDSEDEINLYTLKGTRTFQKNYSFGELRGTILEDYLTIENNIILKKVDLKKDYLDPYSKKHLFDMEFDLVVVSPVKINDELDAFVLYYLNNDESINLLTEKCSNKLYQNLLNAQREETINNLKSFAEKLFDNHWCFISGTSDYVYVSDSMLRYFNNCNELNETYDSIVEKMTLHNFFKDKEVECQGGLLLTFVKKEEEKYSLLAVDAINEHGFDGDITLLYYRYVGLEDIPFNELFLNVENDLIKYIENNKYLVYKCSDKSLIFLIDKRIDKRLLQKIMKTKDHYFLTYVRSGLEINAKADLTKVVEYLEINEDEYFNKDHYLYYRQKMNEYNYKKDRAKSKTTIIEQKLIWNSHNRDILGRLCFSESMLLYPNNSLELQMISEKRVVELLLNDSIENPYFYVDAATLLKRQMWEYLKKIKTKYNNWGIILLSNGLSPDELNNIIIKLKKLEIVFYLDSKVFTNFEYLSLTKNAKGLYLYNKEVEKMATTDVEVLKEFLIYYLDRNHSIIIDINNEMLNSFDHQNIYYITK